jgi:transposase InsO family protein
MKSVRAEALGVNRKNIYRKSTRDVKDEELKTTIKKTWETHPAYGHKCLALELKLNKKRVLRVMKKFGIKPPRRKVKQFCTRSTSHHTYFNLIKNWMPTKPHELWCSDVSFILFQGRWWYLATIVDVFTRQVVAAQIGKYHTSQLILTTIKHALQNTGKIPVIFHTDQGTEFMAKKCTQYMESFGILVSVSDKASPWQNGFQESFFGKFKDEFGDFNRFETVTQLIEEIYAQVHYYNHDRIHTALKMPPARFASLFIE